MAPSGWTWSGASVKRASDSTGPSLDCRSDQPRRTFGTSSCSDVQRGLCRSDPATQFRFSPPERPGTIAGMDEKQRPSSENHDLIVVGLVPTLILLLGAVTLVAGDKPALFWALLMSPIGAAAILVITRWLNVH